MKEGHPAHTVDRLPLGLRLSESDERSFVPQRVDVSKFSECEYLGSDLGWVLQLKGFNRRERILRRKSQLKGAYSGGRSVREISPGAVMIFGGLSDQREIIAEDSLYSLDIRDSRGLAIDFEREMCYVGSVDEILQLDLTSLDVSKIPLPTNHWLAFIHSICLSSDKSKLLVTSPGFDRIIELEISTGQVMREWIAWDHGYDRAFFSGRLIFSRPPVAPPTEDFLVVESPDKYNSGLGLPPAERAAFPNSALYFNHDWILATLFHHGLIMINLNTGENYSVYKDLKNPHAILPFGEGYIVTNTGAGEAIIFDGELRPVRNLNFTRVGGLDPLAEGNEWVQEVQPINDELVTAVDSNRSSVFILDLGRRLIRKIPYDPNWVVQEVHTVPIKITQNLRGTVNQRTGRFFAGPR